VPYKNEPDKGEGACIVKKSNRVVRFNRVTNHAFLKDFLHYMVIVYKSNVTYGIIVIIIVRAINFSYVGT
jgi:chromosome condensin MukBEF MukE localization factor